MGASYQIIDGLWISTIVCIQIRLQEIQLLNYANMKVVTGDLPSIRYLVGVSPMMETTKSTYKNCLQNQYKIEVEEV